MEMQERLAVGSNVQTQPQLATQINSKELGEDAYIEMNEYAHSLGRCYRVSILIGLLIDRDTGLLILASPRATNNACKLGRHSLCDLRRRLARYQRKSRTHSSCSNTETLQYGTIRISRPLIPA